MSNNTDDLLDPWLQAMTIYTISRDRQQYIPLRNLDICVQRSKKFQQDPNATFQVSGTNEQGQRAAIRQVAIDMKLNIVMASRYELEVLKDSNVIGKRAPCAGLLSLEDAQTFQRVFGYPHVAYSLLLKIQSIKALDLAAEPGMPYQTVPSKYCDSVIQDIQPPYGRKNEEWIHRNNVGGIVTVLNLAAVDESNDETRPPVVQQLHVQDVLRVIGTAAYPMLPTLYIKDQEGKNIHPAGSVYEYLTWYWNSFHSLLHKNADKQEPLDILQNPNLYNQMYSLDSDGETTTPGIVSRTYTGDTEMIENINNMNTNTSSIFAEYNSPMQSSSQPAQDAITSTQDSTPTPSHYPKTPSRSVANREDGLIVLPPTPSSHTPRRHIQSSHHANAPPVDPSAEQINSPFAISLVFLKPVSVLAYQLDPPAVSKAKKPITIKQKKQRIYNNNEYDEKSYNDDDIGRRQTRGKTPSGGYAAMLQGRSEIETGLTGTRLSATDYPMVAAKVSNYHHKTRLTFNVPEPTVQIQEPAAKRRRRRTSKLEHNTLYHHSPQTSTSSSRRPGSTPKHDYSAPSSGLKEEDQWFKAPQEYQNYANYTLPMHHDPAPMYVNIPMYSNNQNEAYDEHTNYNENYNSEQFSGLGHDHFSEKHATTDHYNALGLTFPNIDHTNTSYSQGYSESILSTLSDHSSTAPQPYFEEPINLMPFEMNLMDQKPSPTTSPTLPHFH